MNVNGVDVTIERPDSLCGRPPTEADARRAIRGVQKAETCWICRQPITFTKIRVWSNEITGRPFEEHVWYDTDADRALPDGDLERYVRERYPAEFSAFVTVHHGCMVKVAHKMSKGRGL